jgi:hypothetical protein
LIKLRLTKTTFFGKKMSDLHAKNVADGVVFSLYGERRGIDNFRISLVRNPRKEKAN